MSFEDFEKVIKVAIFEEGASERLEKAINEWVETSSVKVVDIKYNVVLTQGFDESGDGGIVSYSALVLYTRIDLRNKL